MKNAPSVLDMVILKSQSLIVVGKFMKLDFVVATPYQYKFRSIAQCAAAEA